MKKLYIYLLLAVSISVTAQRNYKIQNPLQLETVNLGVKSDSVLVRGADKVVKFIPRSEFGGGDFATITYVDSLTSLKVDKAAGERLINASEIINLSNQSGINTGDNAVNSNYESDYRAGNFIEGVDYLAPNGSASELTDFPTLNQNTTGSASTITGNIPESQVTNLVTDLASKQSNLVSGTNIKTVGGVSLLGSGNLTEVQNSMTASTVLAPSVTAVNTAINLKATNTTVIHTTGNESKTGTLTLINDLITNPATAGDSGIIMSKYPQGLGSATILGLTGDNPRAIVLDSIGNVYVSNMNDNTVSKITPAGISTTIGTTGTSPRSIIIDSIGNVYTANYSTNNVSKITPEGVSSILGTTGSRPTDLVMDSSGNIYVSNSFSDTVTKITPEGVSSILGTTGINPVGIDLDSFGNVYTVNYGTNTITKITPEGVASTFGSVSNGTSIYIDSEDNLYVPSQNLNVVYKFTSSGVKTTYGITSGMPQAITMDKHGNLYTFNSNINNISKITPSGTSTIIGSTPSGGWCIAVDKDNNVYTVSSTGDAVYVLPPTGINLLSTDSVGKIIKADDLIIKNGNITLPNSHSTYTDIKTVLTLEYLNTRIGTVAPVSSSYTGLIGEIRVCADGYIYWCVATDTWIRAAGSTF